MSKHMFYGILLVIAWTLLSGISAQQPTLTYRHGYNR